MFALSNAASTAVQDLSSISEKHPELQSASVARHQTTRARPGANEFVDVSSLRDVRTPTSSSSATGAASVGSIGAGASALLDLSDEPPRTKRVSKDKMEPALPLCCALSPDLSRCSSSSASVPPFCGLRREGALRDVAAKSRDIFLVVRPLGSLPNCSKRQHSVSERVRKRPSCRAVFSDVTSCC